jgi:replicative DNA helicase
MNTPTKSWPVKRSDPVLDQLRVPPHSVEAEQSVIGALMLDNKTWDRIADRISEIDFYRTEHQLIFRVITELATQRSPFDVLTISEALKNINQLDNVGGDVYLFELAKNTPSAANIVAYADIVRERSVLRQLISIANDVASTAFNPEGRVSAELLDDAERKIFKIAEERTRGAGPVKISSLLADAFNRVTELRDATEPVTGLATGFIDFDEKTSGLQKGDLIIVAGRPSMGKTTFAMNIAENAAIRLKKPVLIFSMEMSGESLAMRLMSSLGRVDQLKVRTGKIDEDDWPRIASAVGMLSGTHLFIDDTPALSPTELHARARRLAREVGGQLGLIVVDYLQLMSIPGNKENRATEISEISRSLKSLAKELKVPVLALSQLNRGLEQRQDRRPVMSDLRESGSIEQDADVIVFIYRDAVYNQDANKEVAEILISKQRNGPTGKVELKFHGQFTRFDNFTPDTFADHYPARNSDA